MRSQPTALRIVPLTAERWADFEALFGPRGACGGCWCMTPRLSRAEYERKKGEPNRRAMQALVAAGREPGLLAYEGKTALGWIALGPREQYELYRRSRVAKPVDDSGADSVGEPRTAWAVVCQFIAKEQRGRGLSVALLRAAIEHARRNGADVLDAWPTDTDKDLVPVFAWTGIASAYRAAGFVEIARRTPTRPYMRYELRARR